MPSKFQFWSNFDRFLDGKWKHVGTKIESKIDVNFERPILQKVLKNKWIFIDFYGFGGRSWHQKSIKNRSKIEAQDEWPLGIDFWWILVGFGSQVGRKNRAKSDQKSIKKRIEKMMKKRCVLEAPGCAPSTERATVPQGSWDPLITNFQRKQLTTHHTPQTITHALRAPARWRIYTFCMLMYKYFSNCLFFIFCWIWLYIYTSVD